jgi:hypothetical protein
MTWLHGETTITFHETYVDNDKHVLYKYDGCPPAGFNVQVGKDRDYHTIIFYYDRDGFFIAWGRVMGEGIHMGRSDDLNTICRPADRSLLSYDRRRIRALGFNHTADWLAYNGNLPTLVDQVWLSYVVVKGEEIPHYLT